MRRRYALEAQREIANRIHVGVHQQQPLAAFQQFDDAGGLDAEIVAAAERHPVFLLRRQPERFDRISLENPWLVRRHNNSRPWAEMQQLQGADQRATVVKLVVPISYVAKMIGWLRGAALPRRSRIHSGVATLTL